MNASCRSPKYFRWIAPLAPFATAARRNTVTLLTLLTAVCVGSGSVPLVAVEPTAVMVSSSGPWSPANPADWTDVPGLTAKINPKSKESSIIVIAVIGGMQMLAPNAKGATLPEGTRRDCAFRLVIVKPDGTREELARSVHQFATDGGSIRDAVVTFTLAKHDMDGLDLRVDCAVTGNHGGGLIVQPANVAVGFLAATRHLIVVEVPNATTVERFREDQRSYAMEYGARIGKLEREIAELKEARAISSKSDSGPATPPATK